MEVWEISLLVKMIKNKKAAMEMSVGTLVTLVLLMAVLVLGIILIRSIFSGGTDAVETINNQVIDEINNVFSDESNKISVAPSDRTITLRKGDEPAGFAFSVRNIGNTATFSYKVEASNDVSKCGTRFTKPEADSYLLVDSGDFELPRGSKLDLPILVKYQISEDAPLCTIVYKLTVCKASACTSESDNLYAQVSQIFVTIK